MELNSQIYIEDILQSAMFYAFEGNIPKTEGLLEHLVGICRFEGRELGDEELDLIRIIRLNCYSICIEKIVEAAYGYLKVRDTSKANEILKLASDYLPKLIKFKPRQSMLDYTTNLFNEVRFKIEDSYNHGIYNMPQGIELVKMDNINL